MDGCVDDDDDDDGKTQKNFLSRESEEFFAWSLQSL
jgi:hypothetical protein